MAENDESRILKLESDMQLVKNDLGSLTRTIFGIDGEGGLLRKFDNFMTKWTTREEDKKKYDNRASLKLNVTLSVLLLLATLLGVFIAYLEYHRKSHDSFLIDQSKSSIYDARQEYSTVK